MLNLYKALANAKLEIHPIVKNSENPFFKTKYSDINDLLKEIEPILQRNGLMLLQPILDGKVCTSIIHVESGEVIESNMELPTVSDPQKLGSAVTYFRRYTLSSLLSLQSIDDDGEIIREDLERLRQRASDLLDTSVWADDTNAYRTGQQRIEKYSYEQLKAAIAELVDNQRPSDRHSMKEINQIVKNKVDQE
jgi:hypothetical protein